MFDQRGRHDFSVGRAGCVTSVCVYVYVCVFLHCVASNDNLCCSVPPLCPAADSVVVLQEGAGLPLAHTPSDWLESEEFGPVTSDPIFMAADTKTPPPGTLSRVGCCSRRLIELIFCSEDFAVALSCSSVLPTSERERFSGFHCTQSDLT